MSTGKRVGNGCISSSTGKTFFFSSTGLAFQASQHAQELVDWLTKPSSNSSSSFTQTQTSLKSSTVAKIVYSVFFVHIYSCHSPPSGIEKSAELYEQSISHLLLEDAQQLLGFDVGSEVEIWKNNNLDWRGHYLFTKIVSHVLRARAKCKLAPVTRAEGMTKMR